MQPNPPESGTSQARCRECGSVLWSGGTEQFHVDGSSGLYKMLFGEPSDMGDATMPFELLACPSCRRVEIRMPELPGRSVGGAPGLRYACPGCGGDVYHGQTACPSCGYQLRG